MIRLICILPSVEAFLRKHTTPFGSKSWKKIYTNYSLDESYHCYGWDDFDFVYNQCKNIKKESINDLLCADLPPEDPPLIVRDSYCKKVFEKNKIRFLNRYKELYGVDFVF